MKKALSFALMLLTLMFSQPAFAVSIEDSTTKYGEAKTIVFAGGTVSKSGGVHTFSVATPTITGGTITGATIENSAIGATTPAGGSFSTLVAGGLTGAANTWEYTSNGIVAEGATADAFESTLSFVDPTADQTISIPNYAVSYALLGSTLTTNKIDAANSIWGISNGLVYEGATADAFETTVSPADPTADQTVTIPNFAVNYAYVGSTLTTNTLDAANSAWFESGALVFEGATANSFEGRLTSSDWTADQVHTLPDMTGALFMSTLATNNLDAANSVWATSNGIIAEGATADAFETTLTFADPTADQTVTVPATAGAAGTVRLTGATVVITAGTTPTLTVPLAVDFLATDTITTDNQDQTITFSSGGSLGQQCTIIFQTDSGGSNDEVITFHTTLTNTAGTLTLANLTANQYVVRLVSDGTIWHEVSRTGAQT